MARTRQQPYVTPHATYLTTYLARIVEQKQQHVVLEFSNHPSPVEPAPPTTDTVNLIAAEDVIARNVNTWTAFCTRIAIDDCVIQSMTLSVYTHEATTIAMVEQLFHALKCNTTVHTIAVRYGAPEGILEFSHLIRNLLQQRKASLLFDLCKLSVEHWNDETFSLATMPCVRNGGIVLCEVPPQWIAANEPRCYLSQVHLYRHASNPVHLRDARQFLWHHSIACLSAKWGYFSHFRNGNAAEISTFTQSLFETCPAALAQTVALDWSDELPITRIAHQLPLLRVLHNELNVPMLLQLAYAGVRFPRLETVHMPVLSAEECRNYPDALPQFFRAHPSIRHIVFDMAWTLESTLHMNISIFTRILERHPQIQAITFNQCCRSQRPAVRTFLQHVQTHPNISIQHVCAPRELYISWPTCPNRNLVTLALSDKSEIIDAPNPEDDDKSSIRMDDLLPHLDRLPQLLMVTPQLHWDPARIEQQRILQCTLFDRQKRFILTRDAWQQYAFIWVWSCTLHSHTFHRAMSAWLPTLRNLLGGAATPPWDLFLSEREWMQTLPDHVWPFSMPSAAQQVWVDFPPLSVDAMLGSRFCQDELL